MTKTGRFQVPMGFCHAGTDICDIAKLDLGLPKDWELAGELEF